MSNDQSDIAWKVSPREYVRSLDKAYQGERLISKYVTMRDGIKLAVDVHLPGTEDEQKAYPTICVFTPYYRRFAVNEATGSNIDPCPTIAFYRDNFVKRGYALVCVDVRGSGASFGSRDGFRSPAERLDHHDDPDAQQESGIRPDSRNLHPNHAHRHRLTHSHASQNCPDKKQSSDTDRC